MGNAQTNLGTGHAARHAVLPVAVVTLYHCIPSFVVRDPASVPTPDFSESKQQQARLDYTRRKDLNLSQTSQTTDPTLFFANDHFRLSQLNTEKGKISLYYVITVAVGTHCHR